MIERLSRNKRNLVLAGLGLLFLWMGWSIRAVVNPLVIGYLLAFILHPLVERVQLLGFSRRSAVNQVFLSGFVLAVLISVGLAFQSAALVTELIEGKPVVSTLVEVEVDPTKASFETLLVDDVGGDEVSDAGTDPSNAAVEDWLESLQGRVDKFMLRVNGWFGTEWQLEVLKFDDLEKLSQDWVKDNKEEGLSFGVWLFKQSMVFLQDFVGGMFALVGLLFLVPLYCYYLLFELERLHRFLARYIPKADRQRLSTVGREIGEVIAAFFRGRLSVCLIKGLLLSLGLFIAGVDYALLFGILSGFLSLIPFVGAAIGFLMAFVFAVVGHGVLEGLVRTGIVYFVVEIIEGYVLVPRILGESLGLHPLVVIFAIFAGGAAFGTLGIVLALPLTAALVILVRELVLPAMQRMADEDHVA
ncbi:MAG: putative PurR-regulated permease PerM, partial [Gammaproteobacteria bacterium]